MSQISNEKGFSLIELMVVVAIIGILSAVAVPQFQKFQRKAKQSEAKANLAAALTAQKIFKIEHNFYYPNLWATGFDPEGTLDFRILIATVAPGIAAPASYNVAPYRINENRDTFIICSKTAYSDGLSQNCVHNTRSIGSTADLGDQSSYIATINTVKIVGWSRLGGSAIADIWNIDHRKELVNTVNGAL